MRLIQNFQCKFTKVMPKSLTTKITMGLFCKPESRLRLLLDMRLIQKYHKTSLKTLIQFQPNLALDF